MSVTVISYNSLQSISLPKSVNVLEEELGPKIRSLKVLTFEDKALEGPPGC